VTLWRKLATRCTTRPTVSDTGPGAETRQVIVERDWYACLRCGKKGVQIHHRRPRMAGGTTDPMINNPANLVLLCLECHDWIEMNRNAARESGYLLRKVSDAPFIPMLLLPSRHTRSRYVRLAFDGRREELSDADVAYFERYGQIPRKVEG
jgi:hypothetical protein